MKLILVAGLGGAIGSTLAAAHTYGGCQATQLGMVTHSPKLKKLDLPLDSFDDFLIAGWDLDGVKLYEQVRHHACIPDNLLRQIESHLQRIQLRHGLIPAKTPISKWFDQEIDWLRRLRKDHGISSTVLVNLCPTGPKAGDDPADWGNIAHLQWNHPGVTISRLYFRFAIEVGAHFINFTPNECEIGPLTSLAVARGLLFSGRDGKTGQTFLKTLIAPALRDKNFRIDGWFSTNILGNEDGRTLSDGSNAATKISSKSECLPEILGYSPGEELAEFCHQVMIHYYPPRGDAKEAWDNIDFSGMFNQSMQLKLNWLGKDSILAAPAVLDLVRLTFLAEKAGLKGLLDPLGYFFKTPLMPDGQARIHDVDFQYARLVNWAVEQRDNLRDKASSIEYDSCGWVRWPQPSPEALSQVQRVIQDGAWAISGERQQEQTQEQIFCHEFASFVGMPYGVACSSGSTALTIALEAAGIGYGDRVLVPPSPWVACASAVMAVGGIPVFCDLQTDGLCMCPEQADTMLDSRIRAILLVHSQCTIADLPAFQTLAGKWSIPLIEDCSQAHGAALQERMVGSFGDFSVFSMQQTKVLTSGEGGIVLCRTEGDFQKLQQLRSDGRIWHPQPDPYGIYLQNRGTVQGFNYCLSEIQSGLLRAGFKRLREDNQRRSENALLLNQLLVSHPKVRCHFRHNPTHQPSIYEYCISLPSGTPTQIRGIARRLTTILGVQIFSFDPPVYRHILYQPGRCRRFPSEHVEKLEQECNVRLPEVEKRTATTIGFPHRLFLGTEKSMVRIHDALTRVLT